jgi:SAM-dependent methyltransferase
VNVARAQLPVDDNGGWVLLLPAPRPQMRVLCLELGAMRFAEAAAFWFDEVTALSVHARTEARFSRGSLSAETPRAWAPGSPLPYESHSFGVVVCRFAGSGAGHQALNALLPEIARVLEAGGAVYLDIDNPGSYQTRARVGCRRGLLDRSLVAAGFVHRRHHAQIFEHGRLWEVIPSGGYRASRNAWRARERLKELLLGRLTQRWFAPVNGVLAARMPLAPSALEELPAMRATPNTRLGQFLVNPGKCFVVGAAPGSALPLITVVPTRSDTITRRHTEIAALERLQASHLPVTRLLPRVARAVDHGRHPVFEYEAFEGTTIDLPMPDFAAFMEKAFRALCDFNRSSLECRVLTAAEIDALVTRPLHVAAARYPAATTGIERLRMALATVLAGSQVPVTWQHGDYKLENLVFGGNDRSIRAIIDWELSSPQGLAMVDLLYLLAYAEITLGAEDDILPVVGNCMLADRWRPASRALLDGYVREFPQVIPFKFACIGLFLVHHVVNRFAYDARDFNSHAAMSDLMLNIAARIESSAETRR